MSALSSCVWSRWRCSPAVSPRVAFLGSTTSSVIAEASAPDHDTYSLDGISVAESEAERQGFEW